MRSYNSSSSSGSDQQLRSQLAERVAKLTPGMRSAIQADVLEKSRAFASQNTQQPEIRWLTPEELKNGLTEIFVIPPSSHPTLDNVTLYDCETLIQLIYALQDAVNRGLHNHQVIICVTEAMLTVAYEHNSLLLPFTLRPLLGIPQMLYEPNWLAAAKKLAVANWFEFTDLQREAHSVRQARPADQERALNAIEALADAQANKSNETDEDVEGDTDGN